MPLLLLILHGIAKTVRQLIFQEYVILTDKGLFFCQADNPKQIVPFFLEDMLWIAKVLVLKKRFVSGKVVLALRIANSASIVQDYARWQDPDIADRIYDFIKQKLAERDRKR